MVVFLVCFGGKSEKTKTTKLLDSQPDFHINSYHSFGGVVICVIMVINSREIKQEHTYIIFTWFDNVPISMRSAIQAFIIIEIGLQMRVFIVGFLFVF